MPHNYDQASSSAVLGALRLLRPHRLERTEKVRVGRDYDGGYVMVESFKDVVAAYSLGINDDASWDLDIAARGIPVFQYDHSIDALPAQHPLFTWEPVRIEGFNDPSNGIATLESLIVRNGHDNSRDLILKCDIEGSEWPLLQQTPSHVLAKFRQIVIEVHHMGFLANEADAQNVVWAFRNLTKSHRVVHVHANNHSPFTIVGGIPFPTTLELTLVRVDEGVLSHSIESFPTSLDMPCNSKAADLYLGRFTFD